MNWSAYSRYVGDVFGAPLAIEGLGAFFLESVFLGLWLFGWGRLSPARAPGDDLGGRGRRRAVGRVHHGRQLVDAAPRRLRGGQRQGAAHQHLVGDDQPGLRVGVPPRAARLARHWICRDARRVARGTCGTTSQAESFRRTASLSLIVLLPAIAVRDDGRQPPRRDRDHVPADEGRGDGGAVGAPASRARSRSSRSVAGRTTRRRPRSSRSRICCRCWRTIVERTGRGPERAQPAVPAAVRAWGTTSRTCSSSTGRCA